MVYSPRKKSRGSKLSKTDRAQDNQAPAANASLSASQSQSTGHPENFSITRSIVTIIITLLVLNVARICCLLALHPLFGSIASSYNFEIGVQAIDFIIVPIVNLLCPDLVPSPTAGNLLAVFLVWRAPDSFGRILASYSNRLSIRRGPFVFQSIAYWPIRLAGMSATYQLAMKLSKCLKPIQNNKVIRKIANVSLPLVLHGAARLMLPLASMGLKSIPPGQIFNLTPSILLTTTMIGSIVGISTLKFEKTVVIKKVNLVIILGCLMSAIYMPLPEKLSQEPDLKTKSTARPANYRTLARRLSSTGMLLVGELTQESGSQFRFIRCDHSLLGGIWNGLAKKDILKRQTHALNPITTDELEAQSVEEAESIYPAFILQTAVRLVERPKNLAVAGEKEKALVFGLGVGISVRSLMKQDVTVTVVEIDPLVYEYARTYFGLPSPNGGIFLEDGRSYLDRNDGSNFGLFDYVIHDVFTGGAVPSSLFTLECWRAIRAKLKDDGVLAVNLVGIPLSEATSMVFMTLLEIFSSCRVFSEDSGGPISETDYQNMVIFCSPTGKPKFRKALKSDVSGLSEYQLRVLDSFQDHEIDLIQILSTKNNGSDDSNKMILEDRNRSKLDRAQVEAGLHHWEIMRRAIPNHVWSNYYN